LSVNPVETIVNPSPFRKYGTWAKLLGTDLYHSAALMFSESKMKYTLMQEGE